MATIHLGEPKPPSSPMEIVVKRFEARGDQSAGSLVSGLPYWIPELREIFVPEGGRRTVTLLGSAQK